MGNMIAKRLALGLLTLLAVSVLIFAATEILPGDVATAILGQSATAENVEAIRQKLNLHDPAYVRYFRWLFAFLQGDLGVSLSNERSVAAQVFKRLDDTLFLAGLAALVAVPLSVGLGIVSAIKKDSWLDRTISQITLTTISLPEFFIGLVLVIVFAVQLRWFPAVSTVSDGMSLADRLNVVALPATTLVLVVVAHMMRMTRASLIGVMSSPYIEMALLKGVDRWRIIVQHALPNSLAPIVNVIAVNLAYLVVGVIVVEVVFTYPGLGMLMVDAVTKRDIPMVQGCGLVFAVVYIGLNIAADVAGIMANPRLRHPK